MEIKRCPHCNGSNITYNWFYSDFWGTYGHECLDCENVFTTKGKLNGK
jgi:hypothetical protein